MIRALPFPPDATPERRSETIVAALGFVLLTIAMTWPLAAHPARALASDFGDPLFNTWVIGWMAEHLTRALAGHPAALRVLWDANIFFPEPNTLAFSDHLFIEALQVLPVFWATGNLVLCYNVALLLSFALSGLGAFLLLRDLTGSRLAGITAGVFFAFNEYRLTLEISHLQTLSVHWLPFALLGLHRCVATGSRRALAWGMAALVALNLSAGFHALYYTPFVVAFVVADAIWHGKIRAPGLWIDLGIAAISAMSLMLPFTVPYVTMGRQLGFERPLEEVIRFSATFGQYRAALPGFSVPLLCALAAIGLAVSRPDRRWPVVALAGALGLAFWLSLGPAAGLYRLLYDYAPGFRGVRAAARYAMLFFFLLASLAAVGVALIESRARRLAHVLAIAGCGVFLWQTRPAPFPVDRPWPFVSAGLAPVPEYLSPGPKAPPIYRWASSLDPRAVLVEFPFGDDAYQLRYMFFTATSGPRRLGGYSGIFPPGYVTRKNVLQNPLARPDEAWTAVGGATHAIVHADAWPDDTGERIAQWLRAHGAVEVGRFDAARAFALP